MLTDTQIEHLRQYPGLGVQSRPLCQQTRSAMLADEQSVQIVPVRRAQPGRRSARRCTPDERLVVCRRTRPWPRADLAQVASASACCGRHRGEPVAVLDPARSPGGALGNRVAGQHAIAKKSRPLPSSACSRSALHLRDRHRRLAAGRVRPATTLSIERRDRPWTACTSSAPAGAEA